MSIDLGKTTRKASENTIETGLMGADLVTGTAVTIADNVSEAIAHPTRTANKLERRGSPANQDLARAAEDLYQDGVEAIEALMPEKIAIRGLRLIKDRARRRDLVGDVAYRSLEIFNGGLELVLRPLTRLERASEPPARPSPNRVRTPRPFRRAAGSTSSAARSTSRRVRSTARRGTTGSRPRPSSSP
jgi:hypothetical protein